MRAARYHGKADIRIEHVAEEKCGPGQVRIAPSYVGICGTDLHEYVGGPTFAPVEPHPITKDTIPITLGHEFSGIITELGTPSSDTFPFTVGQRVVVQPSINCGQCAACKAGVENVCHSIGFVGLSGRGGGLSENVVVLEGDVHALPDHVPLEVGALVEPLSVGWHAVAVSPHTRDSSVLILGGGPIGLAVLQCLVALKTERIIVGEVSGTRQRFAREFGAHHVLDPTTCDLASVSRDLTNGTGPDVVFDCAGVPASIETACQAVKASGTVVNLAIWEKEVPFQPNTLVFKEARYMAVLGYKRRDVESVISHLADGSLKPQKMITSRVKMDDVVEKGIKTLLRDKENQVKILVEVGGESVSRVDSHVL